MVRRKGNVLSFRVAAFYVFLADGVRKRTDRHGPANVNAIRLHRRRKAAGLISYLSTHVVRKS